MDDRVEPHGRTPVFDQTRSTRSGRRLARTGACVAIGLLAQSAVALTFETRRLTDDTVNDLAPRLAGNKVVWQSGSGVDSEIQLFDGTTVAPITFNGVRDERPAIDGSIIVWQQFDGNDWELVRYDAESHDLTYLTNNDGDDRSPAVASIFTVWVGDSFESEEIFVLPAPGQLTGDTWPEDPPRISPTPEGGFTWVKHSDLGSDVFAYLPQHPELPGVYQISEFDNGVPDLRPAIYRNRVAWISGPGGNTEELWRYDPVADYPFLQVTNDDLRDADPVIGPRRIAWEHWDGNDWEIYTYTEGALTPDPLTNNSWDDWDPQMSGNLIVWLADDGGDSEVWYSDDLGTPTQLTDNTVNDCDAVVDGPRIAWRQCDATDCDIWLAPEPGTTALVGTALTALAWLAVCAQRGAARAGVARKRMAP
jgi:hypothetical protein